MVKRYHRRGLPLLSVIGVLVVIAFYYLFGWLLTLRYLLGAIMFATITAGLIRWLNGKLGRRRIFNW